MKPALPKSLIGLGVNFLTARTARRLREKSRDLRQQEAAFANRRDTLLQTDFGEDHGIEPGLTLAKFRERVPPRAYEGFIPYLARMRVGDPDVLAPGPCAFYAVSSGTTVGRTKYLPITTGMLAHFRAAGLASLLFYTARVGHVGIFRGQHLFLGGSTTLTALDSFKNGRAYAGDLSGITALNLPAWIERHYYEPGREIAQMADWPAKIAAIVTRTRHRDITLVAGIPSWLIILAEALLKASQREKYRASQLTGLWPNLECLVHGGVPLAPFQDEPARLFGPTVNFHEVYPASEGFIAAQDADPSLGLRLMTDVGLFYEFIPHATFDATHPGASGASAATLAEVKTGIDYVLLLTTPAGLTRYVIGDVVRFLSTTPPRLIYVGRTGLQLSAFGEHVIEKELTDALTALCRKHQWQIVNFHVAPLFIDRAAGRKRGAHEWWIELRPGSVRPPIGPAIARELDTALQHANEDYEAKRQGSGLDLHTVRLVIPGTFENWLKQHGKWGGQNKMPRCRSDRLIADELAQLSLFSNE